MSANERVTAGVSLHARCGLRFLLSATWVDGSITANAYSPGIAAPSEKLSLFNCMACSSNKSRHRMWHIRSLELRHLFGRQLQLQRCDGILQMLRLGRPNDG